ncbi:MAG: hypothetical protein GY822_18105 [Deltaproteobacteria bacterium]|nr:hypothetical protein [Deltaproteobacteria bacterium]
MAKYTTAVVIAQAEEIIGLLQANAHQARLESMTKLGLSPNFIESFKDAFSALVAAESNQEGIKTDALDAYDASSNIAEAGYRYLLAFWSRVRILETLADRPTGNLNRRFLVGKVRGARARGVLQTLRLVVPEMEEAASDLLQVGVDDAFLARGNSLIADLSGQRRETADIIATRIAATKTVLAAEDEVLRLLRQLRFADEAVAYETPQAGLAFELVVFRTENARNLAEREARMAAQPVSLSLND